MAFGCALCSATRRPPRNAEVICYGGCTRCAPVAQDPTVAHYQRPGEHFGPAMFVEVDSGSAGAFHAKRLVFGSRIVAEKPDILPGVIQTQSYRGAYLYCRSCGMCGVRRLGAR